jgi:hypothetical protein
MTNFITVVDLIQFFTNEFIKPGNKILLISPDQDYKSFFNFYNSECFSVAKKREPFIDIVYTSLLPFDKNTFDIIICFEIYNKDIFKVLKEDGKMLVKGDFFDKKYTIDNEIFSLFS